MRAPQTRTTENYAKVARNLDVGAIPSSRCQAVIQSLKLHHTQESPPLFQQTIVDAACLHTQPWQLLQLLVMRILCRRSLHLRVQSTMAQVRVRREGESAEAGCQETDHDPTQ